MYCAGAKISFADGRMAVARNPQEMEKVLGMSDKFTAFNCTADSLSLDIEFGEDGAASSVAWSNKDTGEAYALDGSVSFDDAKKIAYRFLETGERCAGYSWAKK